MSHADNGGDGGVSNKTSPCWLQFVKYKGEDQLRTRCKWCGATCASHSQNNGTKSMLAHFAHGCLKYPPSKKYTGSKQKKFLVLNMLKGQMGKQV